MVKTRWAQMAEHGADMTNGCGASGDVGELAGQRAAAGRPAGMAGGLAPWREAWRERVASAGGADWAARAQGMRQVNPCYIPRNHKVEAMIEAAVQERDYTMFHEMLHLLATPYVEQPGMERYAAPPRAEEVVPYTYCGT